MTDLSDQDRWLDDPVTLHHTDPLKRLTYFDTLAAAEMKVIHG